MQKILLLILCSYSLFVQSHTISDITGKALLTMRQGYIHYAVQQLQRAVSVNDIAAQFYMGQCYELGIGVVIDANVAFSMYRRTAERGLPEAMIELARCYRQGIGVPHNDKRADEWLKRYNNRRKRTRLPNLVDIYHEGTSHPENFALNPFEDNMYPDNQAAAMPSTKPVGQQLIEQHSEQNPVPLVGTLPMEIVVKSDVDIEIPITQEVVENVFALIIANENYQDLAKVSYALNDGEVFALYCQNVLGLPSSNVYLVKNATLNNIKRNINIIRQIGEAYGGKASFIIYYAGHGVPDESTRNAFLLPVDGYASDLSTCYSLADFYNVMGNIPSVQTVILLDACFSGATRGDGMLASARGVAIKAKAEAPQGNLVVLSAAEGDETAYSYTEKGHGLFTYYLLKKLQETKGDVTIGELSEYIKENVSRKSIVVNGKLQTPVLNASISLGDSWKEWKLR